MGGSDVRYRSFLQPRYRLSLLLVMILASCGGPSGNSGGAANTEVARLSVAHADTSWNGVTVPPGQNCMKDGGFGNTPAIIVSELPVSTTAVHVEFNDASFEPLSFDGGHGTIGYHIGGVGSPSFPHSLEAKDGTVRLPSVSGETDFLSLTPQIGALGINKPTFLVNRNRATGDFAAAGYLPPCSGGAGHKDEAGVDVGRRRIELGKY